MTLHDLGRKDVIRAKTGENLGRVDDIGFDAKTARIQSVILRGRCRLFGLLGRDEDLEIPWESILSVGADVIMVELPDESCSRSSRRILG